ncbi:MAG: GTP-binding protein, partial [Advenella sp.]
MTTTAFDSDNRVAITAVTGFLGSGKTRYINQLLQQPGMANTVVIVNEIGQLGIDQANWSFVQPSTILLEGGCLC